MEEAVLTWLVVEAVYTWSTTSMRAPALSRSPWGFECLLGLLGVVEEEMEKAVYTGTAW